MTDLKRANEIAEPNDFLSNMRIHSVVSLVLVDTKDTIVLSAPHVQGHL